MIALFHHIIAAFLVLVLVLAFIQD